MDNNMDFLPAFFGTGLFVIVGLFVAMAAYGVAYVCGLPFELSRFVVACAIGGFLGTVLLLWAQFAATRHTPMSEKMETLLASLLWWCGLATLVLLLAR